ncbi:MAG: Rrf2 family transcriptional regulator [Hyphococcus sp.]|nr:MAG: Rrf2 family transcriptional regulator [Marinicaulis sp.]
MAVSTRFAVATHILAFLASHRDQPQTSEAIAKSAGTNPSVVRRLLCALAEEGLSTSQLGKGGGAMLAKGPRKISLLDIFNAVEAPALVQPPRSIPDEKCSVGGNIQPVFESAVKNAEEAFMAELDAITLKDVVKDIKARRSKK